MGMMSMYIPERYDTAYSWYDESDCTSCGKMRCRFQSSSYQIEKESGFIYISKIDSADRMTITYNPSYTPSVRSSVVKDSISMSGYRENVKTQWRDLGVGPNDMLIDTTVLIVGRPVVLTGAHITIRDTRYHMDEVEAVTTINGIDVKIAFDLYKKESGTSNHDYVKEILSSVQTMRFLPNR